MIEPVAQSVFQQEEATTPGSLARNMLAALIREERQSWRDFRGILAQYADGDRDLGMRLDFARSQWLEARHCAEKIRRILYGWEL